MTADADTRTTGLDRGSHSPIREVAAQVGRLWWVPLVAGLVSVGFGIAVMTIDWTVKALVVTAGILLVIRGLALCFNPSYAADGAAEQVAAGVVGVIAGIVLIAWPGPTLLVLAIIFGAFLALSGGFHVVSCVARRRHMPQWGFGVAVGVVELLLGIWVMRRPDVTVNLVITIIGLWTVITGVVLCVQAFEIRHATHELADDARAIDLRDDERPSTTASHVPLTKPAR